MPGCDRAPEGRIHAEPAGRIGGTLEGAAEREEPAVARVVHFEIQADDVDRAKAFYEAVFGWSFQNYGQMAGSTYWGVVTGPDDEPGINGGLLKRPVATPGAGQGVNAFVCTVAVDDYDPAETRILTHGGQVALPKTALTGMAWQGYYLDTEGNTFGIHQPDPEAR